MIELNSTLGLTRLFTATLLRVGRRAEASKSFSFEMLFFLKHYLPQSNVDSYGKFRVDLFPKISVPDIDLYGPVRCLFFLEIPSANDCSSPDSYVVDDPERTTLYIQTPADRGFHRSEFPIIVTTFG